MEGKVMSEWELTDDETIAIIKEKCPDASAHIFDEYEFIARAAQKKLVDWLEKEVIYWNKNTLLGCGPTASAKWQELRKGVGLE